MTAKDFFKLLSHGPRLIRAVISGDPDAIDRIEQEVNAIHAREDRKADG